jgi:GNAT superfamily N-acetyltransferase
MTVAVVPAAPGTWSDVAQVFGARAARNDSCWCQRFCAHDERDNRSALQHEITTSDVPVGLLAYHDDEPVGWSRVVPRRTLPGIVGNRSLQRVLERDPRAWWAACVVVRREHRGAGIGAALLRGAADWARANGASVLHGHPVDVGALRSKPYPSALFTGTLTMFLAAGFVEVGRTYPSRPVMGTLL